MARSRIARHLAGNWLARRGQPKVLRWSGATGRGGATARRLPDGRIFGSGYRGVDEFVWALDLKDGKEIWSVRTVAAERKIGYPEGPRGTPTIDGELLYALSPGGNLVCLETATGKQRWQKDFKNEFGGRMMSGWGFSESPLVDGEQVVCTPGSAKGTILALNKKTGDVLWQSKEFSDRAAYASLIARNRRRAAIRPTHRRIRCWRAYGMKSPRRALTAQ